MIKLASRDGATLDYSAPLETIEVEVFAGLDRASAIEQHQPMNDSVPRPELDAKLELLEARMDARVSGMVGKIDIALMRMDEREVLNAERYKNLGSKMDETTAGYRSLKQLVVGTAVAIFFGVVGTNVAFFQSVLSAFDSGRSNATALNDVVNRIEVLQRKVEQQAEKEKQLEPSAAPTSQPK